MNAYLTAICVTAWTIAFVCLCLSVVLIERRLRWIERHGRTITACPACGCENDHHTLMCPIRAATCMQCGGIATHTLGCARLDDEAAS